MKKIEVRVEKINMERKRKKERKAKLEGRLVAFRCDWCTHAVFGYPVFEWNGDSDSDVEDLVCQACSECFWHEMENR